MATFRFDGWTSFGFIAYVEAKDKKEATKILRKRMIDEIKSGKVDTYTGSMGAGLNQTNCHEHNGNVDESKIIRED